MSEVPNVPSTGAVRTSPSEGYTPIIDGATVVARIVAMRIGKQRASEYYSVWLMRLAGCDFSTDWIQEWYGITADGMIARMDRWANRLASRSNRECWAEMGVFHKDPGLRWRRDERLYQLLTGKVALLEGDRMNWTAFCRNCLAESRRENDEVLAGCSPSRNGTKRSTVTRSHRRRT